MSGERDGDRRTMDGLVRDQVAHGIRPDVAQAKARDAMLKRDRELERRGQR